MARGTGPGALDEERDWRRTALIAAPWTLTAVLALFGVLAARNVPTSPPATGGAGEASAAARDAGMTEAGPAEGRTNTDDDVDDAAASLPAAVELAVLSTARTALGAAGLATSGSGPDRWTLEARVAAVEAITREHAVVTVHGLVIEHRDGGWHGPHPAAVAVLLRTTPSLAVVGRAWPLATPTLPTAAAELRPVEDPDPGLVDPLQDAGWVVEEVTSVETSDDALLRIGLHGAAPGTATATDHVLWLLDAPGGPRLLPLAAPTTTEDLP